MLFIWRSSLPHTKNSAFELANLLIGSRALHVDIQQAQREVSLNGFRSGKFMMLVATNMVLSMLELAGLSGGVTGIADLAWRDCFSMFESELDDDFYGLHDDMVFVTGSENVSVLSVSSLRDLSLISNISSQLKSNDNSTEGSSVFVDDISSQMKSNQCIMSDLFQIRVCLVFLQLMPLH